MRRPVKGTSSRALYRADLNSQFSLDKKQKANLLWMTRNATCDLHSPFSNFTTRFRCNYDYCEAVQHGPRHWHNPIHHASGRKVQYPDDSWNKASDLDGKGRELINGMIAVVRMVKLLISIRRTNLILQPQQRICTHHKLEDDRGKGECADLTVAGKSWKSRTRDNRLKESDALFLWRSWQAVHLHIELKDKKG